jgi:AGZA family xanthine/uracil permease-like MFS transporter
VACKLALPHLSPAISGSPDVAGSMLAQRFALPNGIVAAPPSLAPGFFKIDLRHALSSKMLPFIFVFLFMLMFDAIGTLVGVCEQAGFMRDNKLPRARQAMISDAVGTVAGAALGTSTVTSFIESAAGVEAGGRTGLTALVVAGLFLLALFFSPLAAMAGSYPPATAPALVMVGAMMMRNAAKINWDDGAECFPAFLTMIGIPLSFSIADGLALGFIADPAIKLCAGRGHKVGWLAYLLAAILLVYFIFIRGKLS